MKRIILDILAGIAAVVGCSVFIWFTGAHIAAFF